MGDGKRWRVARPALGSRRKLMRASSTRSPGAGGEAEGRVRVLGVLHHGRRTHHPAGSCVSCDNYMGTHRLDVRSARPSLRLRESGSVARTPLTNPHQTRPS